MDDLYQQSLLAVGVFGIVPVVVASLVGLLVATLQAATQIQEATLLFTVKLASAGVTLWILSLTKGDLLIDLMKAALRTGLYE